MDDKKIEIPDIKGLAKGINKRATDALKALEKANKSKDGEHCYLRGQ